mgnify:CR=1 FL=1
MPYIERRGEKIRVRWKLANGKHSGGVDHNEETGEPFKTDDEAREYGKVQEARIRQGLRKDRQRIKFGEWAFTWYAGQALEPSTMRTYRSLLQGHLMHRWEHEWLDDIHAEDMDPWERSMIRAGYKPRTASDARSLMGNILGDAVPRYLDRNPAARKRGKGRKGIKRVQAYQQSVKVWPSPLEMVLLAERAALLAHDDDVFVMLITKAWMGIRWSELLALAPDKLFEDEPMLNINTKLYELSGFYRGWPKDGSIREADMPPFLDTLLRAQAERARTCTCKGRDASLRPVDGQELVTWCPGMRYLFLTPENAHYQRGSFSSRVIRPAADGLYPSRKDGGRVRPARPVLADVAVYGRAGDNGRPRVIEGEYAWPGRPVHWPWPKAEKDTEFVPPRGRGRPDWWAWPEEERPHLASWQPLAPGFTPHGARHGQQTWMDDAGIKKALKVERMGHIDNSMPGRYGHTTEGMREQLREVLQALWENAIAERFKIWPDSQIPVLDAELARWREGTASKVISQISPRNGRRARPA